MDLILYFVCGSVFLCCVIAWVESYKGFCQLRNKKGWKP